jgi:hypothetical protein
MAIQVQKEKDGVYLTLTTKLDREDVFQLIQDLQKWLYDNTNIEADNGWIGAQHLFKNKEHYEAYKQAQSKLQLSKDMQRDIEERFGNVYKVNPDGTATTKTKHGWIPSEIEIQTLKSKQNGK